MKPLILASSSKQRRALLKMAGLTFRVIPSHAHEKHEITTTCEALVKHNAFLKAKAVASCLKNGVVIGADTVVYGGGKHIIGKPKSLPDARRILRQLSAKPHWVYTGVALVDAKTQKTRVGCERTRIFMQKLTDGEMRQYHRHTNPLDKAGGFDIEGRGGLFISRIEGCYANVIGLPLSKLRLMLRDFGLNVL